MCVCVCVCVCVSHTIKKKPIFKKREMDVMNDVRENIYVYLSGMFLAILHFPWAFALCILDMNLLPVLQVLPPRT